jgi:hypothetical protein
LRFSKAWDSGSPLNWVFYFKENIMAGTITGVITRLPVKSGRPAVLKLVLTCTADATAHTFPATVINDLAVDSDGRTFDLRGLKLYSVKAAPGGTAPTDATDLTITDEYGVDLIGGRGTDFIDATSKTWTPAGPATYNLPALITGDVTVTITNNAVDSAIVTLVLEFVGN